VPFPTAPEIIQCRFKLSFLRRQEERCTLSSKREKDNEGKRRKEPSALPTVVQLGVGDTLKESMAQAKQVSRDRGHTPLNTSAL
jgi:hypothetical protein